MRDALTPEEWRLLAVLCVGLLLGALFLRPK
jgi:hypothetical protein